MAFPSRRFQQAGATPKELTALEQEFAELSPSEQRARESALASVDEMGLTSRLDYLRARLSAEKHAAKLQAAETDQKPAEEPQAAEEPAEEPVKAKEPKRGAGRLASSDE
jgi:hypothetical protein